MPPGEHDAVKVPQVALDSRVLLSTIGCVGFEELDRKSGALGSTVMDLLDRDYGITSPQEALRDPLEGKRVFATAAR